MVLGANCLEYDAIDDLLSVNGVCAGSFFGSPFILEAWAQLSGWAGAAGTIFAAGKTDGQTWAGIYYIGATKKFRAETKTAAAGSNTIDTAGTYDNDSSLHHFFMVVDTNGKITNFFVDGADEGSAIVNTHDLSICDKFYVGQIPWSAPDTNVWEGLINQVRVYGRAPVANEAVYNYNNGQGNIVPYDITDLELWLRLSEGTGTPADHSGNAHAVTLVGTLWKQIALWDFFTWA